MAHTRVAGFEKKGDIRYVMLLMSSTPQQDQRRGAYRLPVNMVVDMCEYVDSMEKNLLVYGDFADLIILETVNSRDISITGIGLVSKREYALGDRHLLRLFFSSQRDKSPPFHICGKVVRFIPWHEAGTYDVGMQFFAQSKYVSEYISRYVLTEQRKQIKQRRQAENR